MDDSKDIKLDGAAPVPEAPVDAGQAVEDVTVAPAAETAPVADVAPASEPTTEPTPTEVPTPTAEPVPSETPTPTEAPVSTEPAPSGVGPAVDVVAPATDVTAPTATAEATPAAPGAKSKTAAGLLGIFFGGIGVHNFYLGNTKAGLIKLALSVGGGGLLLAIGLIVVANSGVTSSGGTAAGVVILGLAPFFSAAAGIWGLIEGILILTAKPNSKWAVDAKGLPLS